MSMVINAVKIYETVELIRQIEVRDGIGVWFSCSNSSLLISIYINEEQIRHNVYSVLSVKFHCFRHILAISNQKFSQRCLSAFGYKTVLHNNKLLSFSYHLCNCGIKGIKKNANRKQNQTDRQ